LFALRIPATHVDIVAQTLERKDSGLASHIPVGDVGLYAEHPLVHAGQGSRRSLTGEERKEPIKGVPGPGSSDRANASQPKHDRD